MSFFHTNVTVGTTPTLLLTVPSGQVSTQVTIQNQDTASIFIGDTTITASGATRGHAIAAGAEHTRLYYPGDKIYAVSAAGTVAGGAIILFNTTSGS